MATWLLASGRDRLEPFTDFVRRSSSRFSSCAPFQRSWAAQARYFSWDASVDIWVDILMPNLQGSREVLMANCPKARPWCCDELKTDICDVTAFMLGIRHENQPNGTKELRARSFSGKVHSEFHFDHWYTHMLVKSVGFCNMLLHRSYALSPCINAIVWAQKVVWNLWNILLFAENAINCACRPESAFFVTLELHSRPITGQPVDAV